MENLKVVVGENLTELRKNKKLTQLELAEKLNYSDKSISKWEKGDCLPELEVLYELCRFYGVTMDYLVTPAKENKESYVLDKDEEKRTLVNHILITVLVNMVFWFIATIIFVYSILKSRSEPFWLTFVYAIPLSCIVTAIFSRAYFRRARLSFFIIWSVFIWSALTCAFLTAWTSGEALWPLYLIGLPAEGALLAWYFMRKKY